jgi:predicted transcriptional regulator
MEANKITLTESKLRLIVRQELKTYLIQNQMLNEAFLDQLKKTVKPAALIAMMLLGQHDMLATGASGGGEGGGKTIEQVLKDANVTDKVLKELSVSLKKEDLSPLKNIYQLDSQIEKLQQQQASQEEIQKLIDQKNGILSKLPSDQAKRIQQTGSAVLRYIKSATPEEIESFQDLTPEKVQMLKGKAFERSISKAGQTEEIRDALAQDLSTLVKIAKEDPAAANAKTGSEAVIIFAANNNLLPKDQQEFNYLDIIKAAKKANYGDYLLVDPQNFTDTQLNGLDSQLDTMSVDKAEQILLKAKQQLQERRLNKLRQRLNELRGVYV